MPVEVFCCYAHEDELLLNELKEHLTPLQRQGLIDVWHDRGIRAGAEWEKEIKTHLNEADIILLLISPDFMYSEYCYKEMQRALERHNCEEAQVIPIILRPIHWQVSPIGKLQALPKNAVPVTRWQDKDQAFLNVTEGIHEAAEKIMSKRRIIEDDTPPIATVSPPFSGQRRNCSVMIKVMLSVVIVFLLAAATLVAVQLYFQYTTTPSTVIASTPLKTLQTLCNYNLTSDYKAEWNLFSSSLRTETWRTESSFISDVSSTIESHGGVANCTAKITTQSGSAATGTTTRTFGDRSVEITTFQLVKGEDGTWEITAFNGQWK